VGVARDHLELMPTFGQYTRALRDLGAMESPGADLRTLDPFGPETRAATQPTIHTSHTCGAGQHVCSVSVQGDVNPCSFLGPAHNAGNIRTSRFRDIWRSSQQMRRMRESAGEFRGGCRARAQTFAGSADAADPWFEEYEQGKSCGLPHPSGNMEISALPLRGLPIISDT
jgi:[mycofactocin precursor peptide]-tyrosine decarboxylase / 3-amino-5-[(4-hydroxyphenyl)methyl]-4,4-dimethylpyrrolidin-2-one synthase